VLALPWRSPRRSSLRTSATTGACPDLEVEVFVFDAE
jgi:hypothetical protein